MNILIICACARQARLVQIESEINESPKDFNAMIGETGRGLNGEQRQRLLIACALCCNPCFFLSPPIAKNYHNFPTKSLFLSKN